MDTPRGSIDAATVVVATDAYTGRAFGALRRTVVAVPSIQVATEPLPQDVRAAILPGGQSVSDTQRILRYFRLDADGRLVLGTRGSYGDIPVPTGSRAHERALRELYPQLAGMALTYRWGGFVAMTRDGIPHLHEPAPGLLAGLGYNGRGVAMATAMGRLLARRALGESAASLEFPVTPVRPIRLHALSRMGARATIRYLQATGRARAQPAARAVRSAMHEPGQARALRGDSRFSPLYSLVAMAASRARRELRERPDAGRTSASAC